MHKIIKEFIETDKVFTDILNEGADPNQPVEVVFPIISKHMNRERLPDATYQLIDDAIKNGHPDEEVFLIFISYVIVFYCIHNMYAKSETTYRISCSFDINRHHVEIQAYYHQSCAYFFHFAKNYKKRDELNLLSMSLMPKSCPRYYKFLSNTGQILGQDGRLLLLPAKDLEVLEKFAESNYVPLGSLLINAIFTVNLNTVDKFFIKMSQNFKDNIHFETVRMGNAIAFIKGDFEPKEGSSNSFNAHMTYYKALKNKDVEAAKKILVSVKNSLVNEYLFGLFFFINLHHAFVIGRYEIIENIINETEKDYDHYLLDFFIARYYLVKNNKDMARYYYAKVVKSCEKYNAIGRLKFEMNFAIELTVDSIFELMQPVTPSFSLDNSKSLEQNSIPKQVVSLGINRIIGTSKEITEVKKKIKAYADIQRPILVIGETGAGKEIVASAIHEESAHKDKPFLAINCGALTDTLLQSELFGYEAGAFTGAVNAHKGIFEAAEDGVVFMDEFGEMSHKLQVSLLRVLENNEIMRVGGNKVRQIRCRIIAATNANIEDLIFKKLFREDLYHRLKQFSISILPLRERKEDIPELINYFLNQPEVGQPQSFSKELILKFQEYHWPGNIRELKNEVDRIKILCGYKPIIEVNDVDIEWLKNDKKDQANIISFPKEKNEEMHQRILYKKLTLADKRNQQIRELFKQYKQLTRGQIAEALEINLLTATKDLKRLCQENFIIKKMPSKSPRSHYFEIS